MGDKKADKQFILEFIEVYRGLPALWDVKCKDYSDRAKKREQYDVLIEKYREKYPNAEKLQVVQKINSLRTNFRKELKRIRDAEKTGTGAEGVEPTLWYYEEMSFLQTQETPNSSISSMGEPQEIHTRDGVHNNEDRGESITSSETSCSANDNGPSKKKRNKAQDPTDQLVILATRLLQKPQDDYEKISAAWAVELRKMDSQQQLFAKKAINDILFEGRMGTLHRNSLEINASHVPTPHTVQSPSLPHNSSSSDYTPHPIP